MIIKPFTHGEGEHVEKGYSFWCPGCNRMHSVLTEFRGRWRKRGPHPHLWHFNGNLDKPTFYPAIQHHHPRSNWEFFITHGPKGEPIIECHLEVIEGKLIYEDCSHELAGYIVDMLPVPLTTEEEAQYKLNPLPLRIRRYSRHHGRPVHQPHQARVVSFIGLTYRPELTRKGDR